jgi:ABC-2 type transport system permease protein
MTSMEETKNRDLDDEKDATEEQGSKAGRRKSEVRDRADEARAAARDADADDEDDADDDEGSDDDGEDDEDDRGGRGARDRSSTGDRAATAAAVSAARDSGSTSFFRNVWTIARRETRSFFDSLVAYVVVGGSMLGVGIYFFMLQGGGFWQTDRASMGRLFDFMPWALAVLVIPLVTMRALAEEKRAGTIELLITMPVRDSEVILGKYFAAVIMCLVLLAASLIFPIAMFKWPWHLGALDWGPVWCGYLGLFLFSCAGVAIGILFSSITESQIISFFLTAGVLVLLTVTGSLVELVHGWFGDAVAFISFQARFASFARGLLDTRAVVYFLSISVICLLGAFRALESRKWK